MTFDEFMSMVLAVFPAAEVTEDSEGQLVIDTNMRRGRVWDEVVDCDE